MGKKGKLLVAQSGGPTAVMNSSLLGVLREAARCAAQVEVVYGARHGVEGLLREDLLDLSHLPLATLNGLAHTPGAALGSCRHKLRERDIERALAVLRAHQIRHFVYIGGNDSAETAHTLDLAARQAAYELQTVVVPKTIDNDLPCTDHTPGYGSAARFLALATADSGLDSQGMATVYSVKIIEVMGRNAGWLPAASALAKRHPEDAPHLIYVPEVPLSVARFLADVQEAHRRLGHVLIVVPETLRAEGGEPLGQAPDLHARDSFGHPRLAGVSARLAELVERELGLQCRWERPGTLQRVFSAYVSEVDRQEAYLVGEEAVRALLDGHSDRMVTLVRDSGPEYRCSTGLAPLAEIAGQEKLLPAHFLSPGKNFVSEAFLDYARPLIGALPPAPTPLPSVRLPKLLGG